MTLIRYFVLSLIFSQTIAWGPPPRVERQSAQQASRRACLQALGGNLLSAAAMVLVPEVANAKNEVFRKNPLMNPVLEQMRIWEQAEADELKYGGELERGDAGNKGKVEAYPRMLVPILGISNDLDKVNQLVSKEPAGMDVWKEARQILAKPEYEKVAFKKIFNRYGDNIYYSDPDRANVYLGGGATPKAEQSLAYLLRNEILTSIEDMQAELDYLIQTPDESTEDLRNMIQTARDAMKRYLAVVPVSELEQAQRFLSESG